MPGALGNELSRIVRECNRLSGAKRKLRCATTSTLHAQKRRTQGTPGPAAARNYSLYFFETVRLKSYPVTCEWYAGEWLRGRLIEHFLSPQFFVAITWVSHPSYWPLSFFANRKSCSTASSISSGVTLWSRVI